jgi:hypothetical protein
MSKVAAWPENYKFAFGQSTQLTHGLSGKTNWRGSEDDFQPLFPSVEMDWPALRSLHCYPSKSLMRARIFGLRWQLAGAKRSEDWSAAATPLFDCGPSFQSGVALRFPPQSKKIWLRLRRAVFFVVKVWAARSSALRNVCLDFGLLSRL